MERRERRTRRAVNFRFLADAVSSAPAVHAFVVREGLSCCDSRARWIHMTAVVWAGKTRVHRNRLSCAAREPLRVLGGDADPGRLHEHYRTAGASSGADAEMRGARLLSSPELAIYLKLGRAACPPSKLLSATTAAGPRAAERGADGARAVSRHAQSFRDPSRT